MALGRIRGGETKQYWLKYERVSPTKKPAQRHKQRPCDFNHGLLGLIWPRSSLIAVRRDYADNSEQAKHARDQNHRPDFNWRRIGRAGGRRLQRTR